MSALAPYIPRAAWDTLPCRIERNMDVILTLLAESGARATFFTLGWIAERYPALVRRIVAQGHELASHGYAHQRATDQDCAEFLEDVDRAKRLLEDMAGVQAQGYRAPSFSFGPQNPWVLDCLVQAGYRYSSSVYPISHDLYGMPDAPRFPYRPHAELLEIPLTTNRFMRVKWPAGGGGYFRLMPYALSRALIRRVNEPDRGPAMFYFHAWELDPGQPRIEAANLRTHFRHYVNLDGMVVSKLQRLLAGFTWRRVDEAFPGAKAA